MSYSTNVHKHSITELGQRVVVESLVDLSTSAMPEMWITAVKIDPKVRRGGGTRYEVWIDGVILPESPNKRVVVRIAAETVKGRALTVAQFLLNLDRPILLDMVRNTCSEWTKMKLGVPGRDSGRGFYRQSDGVRFNLE